ncbi:metal-dependent phosphohydrolase HD sub domain-containing protein [Pseudodesulfovibrio mercurii]|uniref:Metal-dependent phosphohydrolase HD sub domain-containing protein n=1 Tax=Pseudodesulfovibrio mercurii TaxID=641491 RepID=F0JGM6_9BACT|nr:HD domain-containing protein [Pseudodesulfovibrio mercurii]EGB13895.1 metal-dependent phosphohydrolase HD sub domain-containing protein [Pseudodesulfovibrio mercurii]
MSLATHTQLVREFAESHLTGEENNDYHIRLKLDHTMRVLDNGLAIVADERITGRTGELAAMAALYHDIGRFPQFTRYRTFKDADSVNHGRMGVLTLRRLDLPGGFTTEEWRLIRAAVGLHNVKDLNPALTNPLAAMVNVTRDADKIDIFTVILDYLASPRSPDRVVLLQLEEDPARYTPAVMDAVLSGGSCDYSLLRFEKDFLLLMTGWLFSLTYATSARLLLERGLVARTFGMLPSTPEVEALEAKVMDHLRARGAVRS